MLVSDYMVSDTGMMIGDYEDWRRWGKHANWAWAAKNHRKMCTPFNEEFTREMADYICWDWTWEQIKDINFIREYKDKLNWKLLSQYYPFTKEQLKEFEDYIVWDYIAKWSGEVLNTKIIDKFWDKLDLKELLCNYTVKLPKVMEGKFRFYVYGIKDPYYINWK